MLAATNGSLKYTTADMGLPLEINVVYVVYGARGIQLEANGRKKKIVRDSDGTRKSKRLNDDMEKR